MIIEKKKKKIKVDGKEYDLNEFDDTKSWSLKQKLEKRKTKK